MREFDTGATRDTNEGKYDYSGFISPAVMTIFAAYMHRHRKQADGTMRAANNWKKGIPVTAYHESLIRHVFEYWLYVEQHGGAFDEAIDSLCAIMFNVQGLLHEASKAGKTDWSRTTELKDTADGQLDMAI